MRKQITAGCMAFHPYIHGLLKGSIYLWKCRPIFVKTVLDRFVMLRFTNKIGNILICFGEWDQCHDVKVPVC